MQEGWSKESEKKIRKAFQTTTALTSDGFIGHTSDDSITRRPGTHWDDWRQALQTGFVRAVKITLVKHFL